MKLPSGLALSLFAVLTVQPARCADDSVQESLEALRKKVAAKDAERAQQQPQGGSQLSAQLKILQSLIARGDFNRAEQMLENNVAMYGLSPELQEEWVQVVEKLRKELDTKQAEAAEAWRKDIDQLVADSKAGCLAAKSSADLDPLIVRCAALQMRQDRRNVQSERTARKLSGAAATLEAWADFLDFRDAGNAKRANEILRNLRTNSSQYPVLSVQEIDARFVRNDPESLTLREAWPQIFQGVASPDDLPAALERLKKLASNPMNPELSSLGNEQRRMEAVLQAWEAAQRGDDASALKSLERVNSSGGYDDASGYYEPLKIRILNTVLQRKTQGWSKLTQNSGEDASVFLGRILDELQAKNDYATMIEVMKFSDLLARPNSASSFAAERLSIERFLVAQRLEAAGDPLGAMTNYRQVIGAPAGKYVPTVQAQEAFKKLQEKNPELFKSADAAILEEIRGLKMMIQSMMNRVSPGRPPYPMPGQ